MRDGLQRQDHGTCGCDEDLWTGELPGYPECREFGWLFGPGLPDLNRLYNQASWDPATKRWIRTATEPALSPQAISGKDAP